jgi:hypothetical protein
MTMPDATTAMEKVVSPSLMVKRSQLMKAVMKASISRAKPMPGCFNLQEWASLGYECCGEDKEPVDMPYREAYLVIRINDPGPH